MSSQLASQRTTLADSFFGAFKLSSAAFLLLIVSLSAPELHNQYLFSKIGSNTVFIKNPEGAAHQGSATGFEIITPSGKVYTLTNQHVCGLQKDGMLLVEEKRNTRRFIPRRVIEVSDENDLCLVEGLEGYEGLTLASSYEMEDLNYAIGYPLGEALNLTSGFLKSKESIKILEDLSVEECKGKNISIDKADTIFGSFEVCVITRRAIQTNIPIYPGNSGSPMVNIYGRVTGIVFASNGLTHWGSSVPLEDVVAFIKAY